MCGKLDLHQKRHVRRRALYALPATQRKLFNDEMLDWCKLIVGQDKAQPILSELTHKLFGLSMQGEEIFIPAETPRREHGHLIRAWLLREAKSISLRNIEIDDWRRNEDREGRLDQLDDQDLEFNEFEEPAAPVELRIDRIWKGIITAAEGEFDDDNNALALLKYLATTPLEFGSRWPIKEIAELLDRADPAREWSVQAVNNAKAQIETWVVKLKRELGVSWSMALQHAQLLQNDVMPLLQFVIDHNMKTIPDMSAARAVGLSGWSLGRFQRTRDTIARLRNLTGCNDLAILASRISDCHTLAGPPMDLLKHINEEAQLSTKFRNGFGLARVVSILNKREGEAAWDLRKVQSAAQELNNWVSGIDELGLEVYDLEVLFERVALRS